MSEEKKYHEVSTNELRDELKKIISEEVKKLPEYLNSLDTKQRIEIVLKLFPFVFPKVHNVRYEQGEPTDHKNIIVL